MLSFVQCIHYTSNLPLTLSLSLISPADTRGNVFLNLIRDFLKDPSAEQVACHHPKPILLDTGEMNFPYPWSPHIVPVQLLRTGQLVIIGVPAEFTSVLTAA